jgi:pyridoxal phosphate enzyme (YggS family)
MSVKENLAMIRDRIAAATQKAGRDPAEVTLVAVTKTFGADVIEEALSAGVRDIGENRVQEARQKHAVIGDRATWHLVGHLQTNKVRDALKIFSLIHSLDSRHLAEEIEKRATKSVDCLVEVNTSGEESKFGVTPAQVFDLCDALKGLKRINLLGLMTIGPGWAVTDPEASRPCFKLLRDLRDELAQQLDRPLPVLSMGMSADFEIAVEEGSTMVRVGTALFGARGEHV